MPYAPGDTLLDQYKIEALIGQGSFGDVYRVTHQTLRVHRAIKVLRRDAPGIGSTIYQNTQQRFQLEAQLGARLHIPTPNPHLLQVQNFIIREDLLVLEMEYAAGGSLSERIQKLRESNTPFALGAALQIAAEIAAGLAALHKLDIVHRDLKPANILFDEHGHARLADLGLAQMPGGPSRRSQLSDAPAHPGTPEYMSPEQENTTKYLASSSDIYSLGVTLFEMLSGRIYHNLRPGTPPSKFRADLPPQVDALLAKMLAENPKERPWDGEETATLLNETLAGLKAGNSAELTRKEAEKTVREAEEQAKKKAEAEALEQARLAQEAEPLRKAQAEFEEQNRLEAQKKAEAEALEQARLLEEAQREQARLAQEAELLRKAQAEAEELARLDAQKKAEVEALEQARLAQEAELLRKAQAALEEKAVREAEEKIEKARAEAAERARVETERANLSLQNTAKGSKVPPQKSFFARYWPAGLILLGLLLAIYVFGRPSANQAQATPMPTTAPVAATEQQPPTPVFTSAPTETLAPASTPTTAPSPTSSFGIGSTSVSDKDGMVMVYVPEGSFMMGNDNGNIPEKPAHKVFLDAFWLDQTEVTSAQYAPCVVEGICGFPIYGGGYDRGYFFGADYSNYPITRVNWADAKSYCEWTGRRLPTEAEWEKAARGEDGRKYPWGDNAPTCRLANIPSCHKNGDWSPIPNIAPVGSYPDGKSVYGALDMIGNVHEWVSDWYDETYYANSPENNPTGPASGRFRVLRGGSAELVISAVNRTWAIPDSFYKEYFFEVGFRCARNATP